MDGTRSKGTTIRETIYKRYGNDYFKRIGSLGGKKSKGGFSADSEMTRLVGQLGGLSKKTVFTTEDERQEHRQKRATLVAKITALKAGQETT